VAIIGLADDGNVGLGVTTSVVRSAGGSGRDGNEGGDQKLFLKKKIYLVQFHALIKREFLTSFMLFSVRISTDDFQFLV